LAAGFPCIVPSSVLGANGAVPPSERIAMGFIGVGSMGGGHLRTFLGYDDVQAVAACDLRRIFRDRAVERAQQRYGKTGFKTYRDFRELLARDDIDSVTVVVPDHWHALIGELIGSHLFLQLILTCALPPSTGRPLHGSHSGLSDPGSS